MTPPDPKLAPAKPLRRKRSMNLEQTQRLVAQMVMRPLTKDYETQTTWTDGTPTADLAATVIKPNDRLTSFERLEIYNKQYWFRIIECFSDDFPGLAAILGDKKFDALTLAYLHACPSRSYTLRNLGQFLIPFLEQHPELTAPRTPLALDMARFEWAQVLAFDGPGFPPLSPTDLAQISANPATAILHLQPYAQLLDLAYPLDDFLLALKKRNAALRAEASNAIETPTKRKRPRTLRPPRKRKTFLAVHRFHNALYYKRLTPEAFHTLRHLQQGVPLERALASALQNNIRPATIRRWFETWTHLAWFHAPPESKL